MKRFWQFACSSGVVWFVVCTCVFTQAQTVSCNINSVHFPGSTQTVALDVSNDGKTTVGFYEDAAGAGHGFLLKDGVYSSIDFPGATFTTAAGINASGQIVGTYSTPDLITSGYELSGGAYTSITVPGETYVAAVGINDQGDIVGTLGSDAGFLMQNGSITRISYPGADVTYGFGISNDGTIVGRYFIGKNGHGYIDQAGTFTTLDVANGHDTSANGINNKGIISGYYSGQGNVPQGFRWKNGQFQIIAEGSNWVNVFGINDKGELAGAESKGRLSPQHGLLFRCP